MQKVELRRHNAYHPPKVVPLFKEMRCKMSMSEADKKVVREIVKECHAVAVKEAVFETLTQLGFDVKNPLDVQKDIAYLSALRKGAIAAKAMALRAVFTVFIPTVLFLMARGFLEWARKGSF